jgi:S-adenosylmethionine hydrolase
MTNTRPIVTLTTDFGLHDEYVGVLKGVILHYSTDIQIVDITHTIPPQDIQTASYFLSRSYAFFPGGSVHLVIVDPGVGSNRPIIALETDSHYFVGPDNGIFTPIFQSGKVVSVYRVTNTVYFLNNVSNTFHGRDIMAPIAAQIATGLSIETLGPEITIEQCKFMQPPFCKTGPTTLQGEIIHIDHFGNLCTNISRENLDNFSLGQDILIEIGIVAIHSLSSAYSKADSGSAIALFDSHNFLEIAISEASAAQILEVTTGDKVNVSRV